MPLGVYITVEPESSNMAANSEISSKTFCITGKLVEYANRDALIADIESGGRKVVSGVTAKTDYLITNDQNSGSSKMKKAASLGTKILSEMDFLKLLRK